MRIAESELRLLDILDHHGDVAASRQAGSLLGAYMPFARIPAEDAAPAEEDGDGLLAQFGTYDFRGPREFQVDLTRQFIESGEDGEVWQLHCAMFWPATSETDTLGSGDLWSFGLDLDDFFAQVRTLPGWAWALRPEAPVPEFEVYFDQS